MEGSSVTLSCNYSGSVDYLQWYRQYPRSAPQFLPMLFIWSLIMFSVIDDTYEQTIEPNQHEVYAEVGSNVLLSCNYSSADSLLWYKQSPGSAPRYILLILDSTGTEHRADSLDSRFSGKLNKEKTRVDLENSSAEVTDSALYYCALRPTVTGNPETLYNNLKSSESSPGSAPQYLLLIPHYTGTGQGADSLDSRFSGKLNEERTRVDLEISSAEVTDSALYYCALRPTSAQQSMSNSNQEV
ncbi:T cell receptor alpha chain MC.7.G5-like [Oncorhynchus clarkii lewisi]|uniref:T cell receptor alpha chain MC.7.G5-like n=1 Tax=Oncorhynchus clarkii lewisi TaxID=490388 RepID=UPI0039B9BFAC